MAGWGRGRGGGSGGGGGGSGGGGGGSGGGGGGSGGGGGVTGLMRLPKKFYPEFLIVCGSDIQPYLSTPSPSLPPQLALLIT